MLFPLPTQLSGALFLAQRDRACLADQPRVGKTGAALIAADYIFAQSILIITTASGRPVWRRALADWTAFDGGRAFKIIGWPDLNSLSKRAEIIGRQWDLLILDEAHAAKNFDAKRTQAVYGLPDGRELLQVYALAARARTIWALTGTPMPNSPADLYPMMRALCPERLSNQFGPTDVLTFDDFMARYCKTKPKKVGRWKWIQVVIGGQNLDELRVRLDGFILRRTQEDVGIRPPRYDLLPVEAKGLRVTGEQERAILAAAENGSTRDLEMHMGPLRRLTGMLKVNPIIYAVNDEFDGGLDKIVLMAWHTEVINHLCIGLADFGVVRLDGATTAADRATAEARFAIRRIGFSSVKYRRPARRSI